MAYRLNIDYWDYTDPKTNKVLKLRRGDEVPTSVLEHMEDKESFFAGPNPTLLKDEDKRETGAPQQTSTSSPKRTEDNK